MHSRLILSRVPRCPTAHRNECELGHMQQMVQMENHKMGSSMWQGVLFPPFDIEYIFVIWCNICNIMLKCEVHIFPNILYIGGAKNHHTKGEMCPSIGPIRQVWNVNSNVVKSKVLCHCEIKFKVHY